MTPVAEHPGDRLSAYLDGELDAAARAAVDAHLRDCAACRQELEDLAMVDSAARALPVPAPAGYFEALPARVRGRIAARRRRTVPVWTWAAAAALLLAVLTPLTLRDRAAQMRPAQSAALPAEPAPATASRAQPAAPATPVAAATDALRQDQAAAPRPSMASATLRGREPAAPPASGERERASALGRLQERDGAVAAPAEDKKETAPGTRADRPAPPPADLAEEVAAGADERRAAGGVALAGPGPLAKSRPAPAAPAATAATPAPEPQAQPESRRKAAANATEGTLQGAREEGFTAGKAAPTSAVGQAGQPRRLAVDDLGLLAALPQRTAEDARAAADALEDYARRHPERADADEARARAIESLANAWRLGKNAADRERARERGRAYLRGDGRLKDRVRAALARLSD
jgi:hypothetical protein